jgi:hypothetical protein
MQKKKRRAHEDSLEDNIEVKVAAVGVALIHFLELATHPLYIPPCHNKRNLFREKEDLESKCKSLEQTWTHV